MLTWRELELFQRVAERLSGRRCSVELLPPLWPFDGASVELAGGVAHIRLGAPETLEEAYPLLLHETAHVYAVRPGSGVRLCSRSEATPEVVKSAEELAALRAEAWRKWAEAHAPGQGVEAQLRALLQWSG